MGSKMLKACAGPFLLSPEFCIGFSYSAFPGDHLAGGPPASGQMLSQPAWQHRALPWLLPGGRETCLPAEPPAPAQPASSPPPLSPAASPLPVSQCHTKEPPPPGPLTHPHAAPASSGCQASPPPQPAPSCPSPPPRPGCSRQAVHVQLPHGRSPSRSLLLQPGPQAGSPCPDRSGGGRQWPGLHLPSPPRSPRQAQLRRGLRGTAEAGGRAWAAALGRPGGRRSP
mmetsp:Transcript_2046/g.6066  ORF Transcript_2046/g.6066 Transcript_2046/m.6066 type:complete len:226 (-) Transcript_2046:1044-1721(-)